MSYFLGGTGRVVVWRQSWDHSPSVRHPVRVDGVVCTTKLQWLAHTLGHEMLHALLDGMCNAFACGAPCNRHNNGHGAAFVAANELIFGHRGFAYTLDGAGVRGRSAA